MSERARRWMIAVAAMAIGVLAVGALMPVHASEGTVEYRLAWDTSHIDRQTDGSWTTTTDLGYTVRVNAGTITTFSATMNSCDHGHGLFGWLFGLIGSRTAHAGHSSESDPALVSGPVTEDLIHPTTTTLGSATVHEPAFCDGHTAWGTLDPSQPTLTLNGTWTGPNASFGTLDIASTIDWGVVSALQDGSGPVHIEIGEPAVVQITRSLSTAFDGIDFRTADADEVARGILRSIARGTEFFVVEGEAHA